MRVRLHAPLDVQSGCHMRWRVTEERGAWVMVCDTHSLRFSVAGECPSAYTTLQPGLVDLAEGLADRLVKLGVASVERVVPESTPVISQELPINRTFVEHGLPPIDQDLMRAVAKAAPKAYSRQPRLAADLGVDGDDMDEIIRLARS